MKTLFKTLGLIAAVSIIGCADQKTNKSTTGEFASQPEVRAADKIGQSFKVIQDEEAQKYNALSSDITVPKKDSAEIAISKEALDKEFLLSLNMLNKAPVAMFHNLKSRVVAFKRVENSLYLMEATDGHIVREDIPAALILTEFKITKEQDDMIYFDFNKGMSRIFVMSGWFASDYGKPVDFAAHFKAAPIRHSFIIEANSDNNRVYIRQEAQLALADQLTPVEARYILEPYRPNPNFKPTRTTNFKRMGFFEIAPRFNEHGTQDIFVTKFDHNKPITFAWSANTPKEYKTAVRDGILYWNKAFGKEVIKAIEAPEGVTAPHPDYNVVQWVNWDTAGFAYADAQGDPRTGEIRSAQVMFTSVFGVSGRRRAKALLDSLKADKKKHTLFALRGFEKTPLCHREEGLEMAAALAKIIATDDDQKILEISADYIREVVAHEIGHTLGLRHNFAGSLHANYDSVSREAHLKTYLEKLEVAKEVVPSSSTMEYNQFVDSAFMGNQMRSAESVAYPYDLVAVQYLYEGKKAKKADMPLFCTDSQVATYADCERFDLYASRSEESDYHQEAMIESLPRRLLNLFMAAKDPIRGHQAKELYEVALSPKAEAGGIYKKRLALLQTFAKTAKMLAVHRSYDYINELNIDRVKEANYAAIEGDVLAQGGVAHLFRPLEEGFADEQFKRFKELLEQPSIQEGVGPGGRGYSFTAEDNDLILKMMKQYFAKLEAELVELNLSLLGSLTGLAETPLSDVLAEYLAEQSAEYLLSTTGETITSSIIGKDKKATPVEVPVFTYDLKLRKRAVNLLRKGRSSALHWGLVEHHGLNNAYNKMVTEALGGKKLAEVNPATAPENIRGWLLENLLLSTHLGARAEIKFAAPTPKAKPKH